MKTSGLRLLGLGRALPEAYISNEELSRTVDTSDEWIRTRTGIEGRRICRHEDQFSLALEAGREAVADAGVSPSDIRLILTATATPTYTMPSTSALAAGKLGLSESCAAMDINAACSGFIYAMRTAKSWLSSESTESPGACALIIASEQFTRILDLQDRSTCVLFGDGAAAALVTLDDTRPFYSVFGTRSDLEALKCPGVGQPSPFVTMDGPAVFRFAVEVIPQILKTLASLRGIPLEEADEIVCHQANKRILTHAAKSLGLPQDKFFMNLMHYGNTSAASIPLALYDLKKAGRLSEGRTIYCAGFGAGLTYGGISLDM